jgi:hypothetical protein
VIVFSSFVVAGNSDSDFNRLTQGGLSTNILGEEEGKNPEHKSKFLQLAAKHDVNIIKKPDLLAKETLYPRQVELYLFRPRGRQKM